MLFNTLVIGSGISGLSLALHLAENGQSVCLITKESNLEKSNTYYAQGGIVALGEKDSPDLIVKDIIKAGGKLVNKKVAKEIASTAFKVIKEFLIEKVGVEFSQQKGKFVYTKEGAHSIPRILFQKDYTGREIELKLIQKAKANKNIEIITDCMAIDLIDNTHHSRNPEERYRKKEVWGVYAYLLKEKRVIKIFAESTVLATGGVGYIFKHTTNPDSSTGDGIAMAIRTGCEVINTEFIQFHPTTLYLPYSNERFLISESVRGEGAEIVDKNGYPFIKDYHPLGSLAPRDIVSRAIFDYLTKTKEPCVYLDLTKVKEKYDIKKRFPQIYKKCIEKNIDIENNPVPVIPAAHYFCGGIKAKLNGETGIKRLYAIGECACTGLHGANRLASTSLLEGLVMAYKCAETLTKKKDKLSEKRISQIPDWIEPEGNIADPVLIEGDIENIRNLMWNYAGIIRSPKRLKRLNTDLLFLYNTVENFYKENKLSKRLIELRNMITVARVISSQALRNRESSGCHYITSEREDL
ncbi:L-aspartate oxidase [Thermotomaculum hydrothermale]|uniref:L-aspartate oxidase n=1 Tax=Thermotomaculum hydrothermale TaxID=981385 RepID=A0A7R6SZE1_9BACT|nr:L-aspartate oxidase [Thermotomaculum hydrothermale]BBB33556.1 L-aspartate oxidase [Thermotomaculum hydrothermale]